MALVNHLCAAVIGAFAITVGEFVSGLQGCIQKFQDSTCKKKFAYLRC